MQCCAKFGEFYKILAKLCKKTFFYGIAKLQNYGNYEDLRSYAKIC